MKGIIFNLLESVVVQEHGEAAWEKLLELSGVDGAYTAVGSYPDEELKALVGAGSELLGVDPDDLVRWFGRACMPLLVQRYGAFFEPHTSTRAFLLTLNDVIHPEVRKLFPGAYAPSFEFETPDDGTLSMAYISHRDLCAFAEGLIQGAALHFGEEVTIDQARCTRRGDDRCRFVLSFRPVG